MWMGGAILTAVMKAAPYDCVTERGLVKLTGLTAEVVAERCGKLVAARLLRKTDRGCHRLTSAGRAAAAQEIAAAAKTGKSELHQRTWDALRVLQPASATIPQLIEIVAQGGEKRIVERICGYLCTLARGGYVAQMPVRSRSIGASNNGHTRWKLVNDTGELAPVWRRRRGKWKAHQGTLYDPNTRAEIKLARVFARASRRAPAQPAQ